MTRYLGRLPVTTADEERELIMEERDERDDTVRVWTVGPYTFRLHHHPRFGTCYSYALSGVPTNGFYRTLEEAMTEALAHGALGDDYHPRTSPGHWFLRSVGHKFVDETGG